MISNLVDALAYLAAAHSGIPAQKLFAREIFLTPPACNIRFPPIYICRPSALRPISLL